MQIADVTTEFVGILNVLQGGHSALVFCPQLDCQLPNPSSRSAYTRVFLVKYYLPDSLFQSMPENDNRFQQVKGLTTVL